MDVFRFNELIIYQIWVQIHSISNQIHQHYIFICKSTRCCNRNSRKIINQCSILNINNRINQHFKFLTKRYGAYTSCSEHLNKVPIQLHRTEETRNRVIFSSIYSMKFLHESNFMNIKKSQLDGIKSVISQLSI